MLAALVPSLLAAQAHLQAVRAYVPTHQGGIVAELRELLAIPNVAADSANIRRNAQALVRLLERRGVRARLLETGGPPLVFGDIGDSTRPTVLLYCHYDGQPVSRAAWAQPDPWAPVLRTAAIEAGGTEVREWPAQSATVPPDWRVYARSASDDKAPIVALLAMLDAWNAAGVAPPNRLKFLFEGDEEAGSAFIADAARQYRDLLRTDLTVLADGPIHPSNRPTAVFGVRGIVTVRLTVYGPIRPLHSGHYGNWAPNPAMRLAQLLASMKGPHGQVTVAGWEDDVVPLTAADRAAIAAYPHDDDAERHQFQLGSTDGGGLTRLELNLHPSLNVRGMRSLFTGAESRTLVPDVAVAELDLRLVAGNDPARQVAKLQRHIEQQGYRVVRDVPDSALRVATPRLARLETWGFGYPAARTPLDGPVARAVLAALGQVGRPVVVPMLGGSVPAYVFPDILKSPFVSLPTVNHDNNQNAENENIRLGNLFASIEMLAAVAGARLR
jgi:acetylornithine deacetylase/succinyl-diaminopimelate desuccinylase-like protein